MFLKVSDGEGGWWIFENSVIHYQWLNNLVSYNMSLDVCIIRSGEEYTSKNGKAPDALETVVVATLGEKLEGAFVVAFDTLAYICSDEGKTIEKITP